MPDEYLVWISEVKEVEFLAAGIKFDVNTGSTVPPVPLTHLRQRATLTRRPKGRSLVTLKICFFGNWDQCLEK